MAQRSRNMSAAWLVRHVLWTLGKAQQVVGLLTVILGLDVFVASRARGNDNPDRFVVDAHPEAPLPRRDPRNGIRLRDFPTSSVGILSANELDAIMCALSVCLVDARDLMVRHSTTPNPTLVIPA